MGKYVNDSLLLCTTVNVDVIFLGSPVIGVKSRIRHRDYSFCTVIDGLPLLLQCFPK